MSLINRKNTLGKKVFISLVTPKDFDISPVLDQWMADKTLIRYIINKSGGVTGFINDGVTREAGPGVDAILADGNDPNYTKGCSRINFTSPKHIAALEDYSIPNVRKVATGDFYVANGIIQKFPDDFRRKPFNPGFVNSTYEGDESGEFVVNAEDETDWEDSDVEEV